MKNLSTEHNIAVLIDADNIPGACIGPVFSFLDEYGGIRIRRAYGNWGNGCLAKWREVLPKYAIQAIQQYHLIPGKNACDIAIVIDAMDLLYANDIDVFCIVSSDCDFTPLAMRLVAAGKTVIGFGEQKTPAAFVNACSHFEFLAEIPAAQPNNDLPPLVARAVQSMSRRDGWTYLSDIGLFLKEYQFNPREHGFRSITCLLQASELVEFRDNNRQVRLARSAYPATG